MFNQQPEIKLSLSKWDELLDIVSFAGLVLIWAFTIYFFMQLPDIIPIHFDLKGNINRHGSKNILWIFPVLGSILVLGLTLLNRYPAIFNYPVKLTTQNVERQYRLATRFIRVIKCGIVLVFLFCLAEIRISAVDKNTHGMGMWYIFGILFFIISPVIVYLYFSFKK
ncbi:MAG: DUF1648 domain-containing protein [Ferruginibacter sp.]